MGEAKQCDVCQRLYSVSGVDDRKYTLYEDRGKEELETIDLCDVCYAKLPVFKKQKQGHEWSEEQRAAASVRMSERQAQKRKERDIEAGDLGSAETFDEEGSIIQPALGLQSVGKKGLVCEECNKPTAQYSFTRAENDGEHVTILLCKTHARNAEKYQGYQTAKQRDDAYMTNVRRRGG